MNSVVLENSYMAKLAPNQYLLAQSRSKVGRYDIDDTSVFLNQVVRKQPSLCVVLQDS